jgi:hypothetical protein
MGAFRLCREKCVSFLSRQSSFAAAFSIMHFNMEPFLGLSTLPSGAVVQQPYRKFIHIRNVRIATLSGSKSLRYSTCGGRSYVRSC